jgi:heme-degrading monooxygenase HmoA
VCSTDAVGFSILQPVPALGLGQAVSGYDASVGAYAAAEEVPHRRPKEETVIARIWRGAVQQRDADAYAEYMTETGVAAYASTPGNRAVWMLRRDVDEQTEFVMLTLWDSLDAVKAFAGDDYQSAVFYPEDDRFLVERDLEATHYVVAAETVPDTH